MTAGPGATLLLLHPLGGSGGFWGPVADLLDRRVLAPDLPGHGSAAPPSSTDLASYAGRVLDDLADGPLTGPVVAVGISLGGLVAQQLAGDRPDLVAALVVVDAVAVYPPAMREMWTQRAATARGPGGMTALADAMSQMWFSPHFRDRHPGQVAAAWDTFVVTDPEGYARACEVLREADTTGLLGSLGQPALVVCGDQDLPAFTAAAPELAAALPDAELAWLRGAQHASVLEQPETFVALLRDFLDRRGL